MSTIARLPLADRRAARLALLVAGLCVVGLALTWVLAELVPITHVKDAVALYDFTRLNRPLVEVPANVLLDLLYPPFFALWGLALVWCALLVTPPAHRRLVAMLGGVFALAVGVALLVLAWHMPSDVVGGYLLATFWAALAFAALRSSERDGNARAPARTQLGGPRRPSRAMRAWSP